MREHGLGPGGLMHQRLCTGAGWEGGDSGVGAGPGQEA